MAKKVKQPRTTPAEAHSALKTLLSVLGRMNVPKDAVKAMPLVLSGGEIVEPETAGISLVMVSWVDSAQPFSHWTHLDDLPSMEVVECRTVGWLVAESDDVLMLAQNLGDVNTKNAQASGLMRIPRACVREVNQLGGFVADLMLATAKIKKVDGEFILEPITGGSQKILEQLAGDGSLVSVSKSVSSQAKSSPLEGQRRSKAPSE